MRRNALVYLIAPLALLLWSGASMAQVPETLGYSGFLADDAGPVTYPVDIELALFESRTGSVGETAVWQENHADVGVAHGLFAVSMGSRTRLDPALLADELYLEVTVNGETMAPRVPLESVPYAVRAGVADTAESLTGFDPEMVQPRFSADCGAGSFIRSIDEDGTVVCASDQVLSRDEVDDMVSDLGYLDPDSDVLWDRLVNVPEGFADGIDDDTTLTEEQIDELVADNNFLTPASDLNWNKLVNVPAGFADDVDNDSQLNEAAVDGMVSDNGYLASDSDLSWGNLVNVPLGFADGVDDDTPPLSAAEVDGIVADNGYLTAASDVSWDRLIDVPAGFADDVDNDTQLSAAQVDGIVSDNGYLTSSSSLNWNNLSNVPGGFADGIDHDSQLTETDVDGMVANNGYLTSSSSLNWNKLYNVPSGFSDGVDNNTQLNESQVDSFVADNGYLTSSSSLNWNRLYNVPGGFSDGVDNDTIWPSGSYCILRRGSTCPSGFSNGWRKWDDEDIANHNAQSGVLPDGSYDSNTEIRFCCK